jgi:hypothetical protein
MLTQHHCAMANASVTVFAQLTNVCSIHRGFYMLKMKGDNQKKFFPQLAIDTKFFHYAFANPCTM